MGGPWGRREDLYGLRPCYQRNHVRPICDWGWHALVCFLSRVCTCSHGTRARCCECVHRYRFEQDGAILATVPDVIRPPDLSKDVSKLFQPFQPPQFGFTFLGTSHGFDPAGQTVRRVVVGALWWPPTVLTPALVCATFPVCLPLLPPSPSRLALCCGSMGKVSWSIRHQTRRCCCK